MENVGLSTDFPEYPINDINSTMLPVAKKIAAKTIGLDIVSVQPMAGPGISKDEMDRIEAEIKQENRDSKIDAIIEGKEYKEKIIKDHPDYKKGGSGSPLFYIDYEYKSENNNKK
jgi:hypothetical protein